MDEEGNEERQIQLLSHCSDPCPQAVLYVSVASVDSPAAVDMDISKITSFPWADPVAVCSQLLPGKCCHTFLDDFNFTDEQCIKTSLSKFIGMGIIIGSTLVKMPQVIKISKAKSSVGISFWGVLLELMAITFNTAYSFQRGYPFSAWGEALFILIETGIIAFLVLWYTPNRSGALAFLLSISSTIYILTFGLTPINILWYLQACNLPLAGN